MTSTSPTFFPGLSGFTGLAGGSGAAASGAVEPPDAHVAVVIENRIFAARRSSITGDTARAPGKLPEQTIALGIVS